ncbi:unnamed protein product [Sphenostylis stenocarpa]|uniref:Uncharacterized protein n=1 Tax=Sphenostylis stenocarpa TaxID=92480 RepID=A0AA87B7K6_9FABA|nr:unnamed protein product [Sphenostylis stenocarpa]
MKTAPTLCSNDVLRLEITYHNLSVVAELSGEIRIKATQSIGNLSWAQFSRVKELDCEDRFNVLLVEEMQLPLASCYSVVIADVSWFSQLSFCCDNWSLLGKDLACSPRYSSV